MNLNIAVEVVWDDVRDSVLQLATVHEAIQFARTDASVAELANIRAFNPTTYDAYVTVRAASDSDVAAVVSELT